jgi:hypothetical protein
MNGYGKSSVAAHIAASIAVVGSLLAGCGQKGPLYIPGVEHPEGGVVRLAVPASAPGPASAPSAAGGPKFPS